MIDPPPTVRQMRVAVTASDYDATVAFYRDVLGLGELEEFVTDHGRGIILEAGSATFEILDEAHAAHVDDVEVGRRVAGPLRVAFEVDDAEAITAKLVEGGATLLASPSVTPWNSLNGRVDAPAGLQLTLFTELGPA